MGPLDFLDHLFNFLAPALWVALGVATFARFALAKSPSVLSWRGQLAINFVVCAAALAAGLWVFGRDGKMATYAALVLACASSQWLLSRGWKC